MDSSLIRHPHLETIRISQGECSGGGGGVVGSEEKNIECILEPIQLEQQYESGCKGIEWRQGEFYCIALIGPIQYLSGVRISYSSEGIVYFLEEGLQQSSDKYRMIEACSISPVWLIIRPPHNHALYLVSYNGLQ